MSDVSETRLYYPVHIRRGARRWFCWNALLWGLGNGLISSSLVIYIVRALAEGAMSVAAMGLAVSWIIAAPRLIGLLRIFTPTVLDFVGSRKCLCFAGYLLSPLVLLLLPGLLPIFARLRGSQVNSALWLIGVIWALYHLIEYFASVALWTWLGDFLPGRTRSRFLARRDRWLLAGQMAGMLAAGGYTWLKLAGTTSAGDRVFVYLPPARLGIAFLLLAAIPILFIPEIPWRKSDGIARRLAELLAPIRSSVFAPFLLFGCWIQVANGLTQSPQTIYQMRVLGVSMLTGLALLTGTKLGQILLSSGAAKAIDRYGAVRVTVVSLLIVSTGPLCYMVATPQYWQPIILAAALWSCWIGVNLGIENLTISLAPPRERSSFIAFYFTAATGSFGVATLIGGFLFDRYKDVLFVLHGFSRPLDYYEFAFLAGWLLRSLGVAIPLIAFARAKRKRP